MPDKDCPVCGKHYHYPPSWKGTACSRSCARRLHRHSDEVRRRIGAAAYGGKEKLSRGGYVGIYNPDHPKAKHGRVREHVLLAEKALGRILKKGEVVHHINGNRKDNRNNNLLVCSNSYHIYLHAKMRESLDRDLRTGKFLPRKGESL